MLTGFFRGPPLVAHALLVALVVALLTPIIAERAPSRGAAFLVAVGLVAVYFFVALVWGSRHILFSRRPVGSDEPGED
ncbi:MAG: hypothetical protein PVJ80_08345 [Gemmatimonadota bacterium]|jgi:hypothetical protein